MYNSFRRIIIILFKIENAPTTVAFLVSFGVVILDLANIVSTDIVLTTLLFAVGILAVGTLVERITYLERIEERVERLGRQSNLRGISQVFQRRDQLPEYQAYIAPAKTEILITGLALATTTVRFLDLLKNKAISGCSIKILLIAPADDEEGRVILRSLGRMIGASEETLKNQINSSFDYLTQALATLEPEVRTKFEVKTYRLTPTYGVLAVDGGLPTGKILLALYPYRCSEVSWPVIELRRQGDEDGLYDFFYDRTKQMWLDATPWKMSG